MFYLPFTAQFSCRKSRLCVFQLTRQVFGFDFASEEIRRETLDQVLDTRSPQVTRGVVLAGTGLPVTVMIGVLSLLTFWRGSFLS